jgi:hypothetical protein
MKITRASRLGVRSARRSPNDGVMRWAASMSGDAKSLESGDMATTMSA